jgi:glutathione synthase/RimK-type ligase-like ATP-grasp enzyme
MKSKNKKNIVVIYRGDDWKKDTPISSVATRNAFEDWHRRGDNHNVEIYRASIQWYDFDKNLFSKAWAFRGGKWLKLDKPIKPDMIFDKIQGKHNYNMYQSKIEINKKTKIVNSPLFRAVLDNKLGQYMVLNEFMPKSYVAGNKRELQTQLRKIKGQKVVLKTLYGSGGFGVRIIEKNKAERARVEFPILVQAFIRGMGIPGLENAKSLSDLRVVFYNHKPVYAVSRIAKKGSYYTNFHQGATAVHIPMNKIPKNLNTIMNKIVDRLRVFPTAHYSLDFIFDRKAQPYLLEMNTTPGFDLLKLVGDEKTIEKNFVEFIKLLEEK